MAEINLDGEEAAFLNDLQRVDGISVATLVSYNGEYMSRSNGRQSGAITARVTGERQMLRRFSIVLKRRIRFTRTWPYICAASRFFKHRPARYTAASGIAEANSKPSPVNELSI